MIILVKFIQIIDYIKSVNAQVNLYIHLTKSHNPFSS